MERHERLTLTPRLQQLADWVEQGVRIADIGTDHGLLPSWLVLQKRVPSAIATDLRPGPLARARATIRGYGLDGLIDLRLGDGLAPLSPNEVDMVVIAGMGGENIAAILSAASWICDHRYRLLLQPMSRAETLRGFLADRGYKIARECLVEDRGVIYPVILARKGTMSLTIGEQYGGVALLHDPLEDRYLIEWIIRMQRAVAGLNHSSEPGDRRKADQLREIIAALLSMREEWRDANSRTN